MVRNRAEPESLFVGQKEEEIAYMRAVEIAKACDNLPPLKEDFVKLRVDGNLLESCPHITYNKPLALTKLNDD